MNRLAIICAHPVQYYAPLFQLIATKHTVKVFYRPRNHGIRQDKDFNLAFEWDLPLLEGYDYEFNQKLKCILAFKPTAVLVYGWAYFSHMKTLLYFQKRIPVLFRGDSTLLDPKPGWLLLLRKVGLKLIYKRVDFAYYVGSKNKAYFKSYGLTEKQLIYMPHSIDITRFSENRKDDATKIRAVLGIKEEEIVILFTGKFIKKKGPGLLLKAFSKLDKAHIHLLFVGSGILEPVLKREAISCVNRSYIHFLPFQNQTQMPAVYQSCDLLCLPSTGPGETWGLAINEAMAARKAILASDAAGAAYDLVSPSNGATFMSNNLNDLFEKLEILTSNKEQLAQMGLQSYQSIQNFSFQQQINALYGS
jgi:glycosyltransferase involved in cell wall biosynthesis